MPDGVLVDVQDVPTFNAPDPKKAGRVACHKQNPGMAGDTIVGPHFDTGFTKPAFNTAGVQGAREGDIEGYLADVRLQNEMHWLRTNFSQAKLPVWLYYDEKSASMKITSMPPTQYAQPCLGEPDFPTDDEDEVAEMVAEHEIWEACRATVGCLVDAVERRYVPDVAKASTEQFANVMDDILEESAYFEQELFHMFEKIRPSDGNMQSNWLVLSSEVMFMYMHVEMLLPTCGCKSTPRDPCACDMHPILRLTLARRRSNLFPIRFRSNCGAYLLDQISYLEYGSYELDLARINPVDRFSDNPDVVRIEDVHQIIVTHKANGPALRDVSESDPDLDHGEVTFNVMQNNLQNNVDLHMCGGHTRFTGKNKHTWNGHGNKLRVARQRRVKAGIFNDGTPGIVIDGKNGGPDDWIVPEQHTG